MALFGNYDITGDYAGYDTGSFTPQPSLALDTTGIHGAQAAEIGQQSSPSLLGGDTASGMEFMSYAGPVLAIFGAVNSAIGTSFKVQAQKDLLASQESSFLFKKAISNINAERAGIQAEYTLFAGAQKYGQYSMRAGQAKASLRASLAAKGVQLGVGSAKEVEVSFETMKQIDLLTMDANTLRAAEAVRAQRQNYQAQARMEGVSADNLHLTGAGLNPFAMGSASLLGSAGSVANTWYQQQLTNEILKQRSAARYA